MNLLEHGSKLADTSFQPPGNNARGRDGQTHDEGLEQHGHYLDRMSFNEPVIVFVPELLVGRGRV